MSKFFDTTQEVLLQLLRYFRESKAKSRMGKPIFIRRLTMALQQAVVIGLAGNEISKEIAGTSEVSFGRSAVATGAGATAGAIAAGTIAIGTGIAFAPVVVPLAVASGVVSLVASLFDW